MKRLLMVFIMLLFLLGIAVSVQAADSNYRGDLIGEFGNEGFNENEGYIKAKYQLSNQFGLESAFGPNNLKGGINFQYSDVIGLKLGACYDLGQNETIMYSGFNFQVPFGSVKFAGSYDQNVNGKDWATYEASFRIQMYDNLFIYAGVRGDTGASAPHYDYYDENVLVEPLLFIKADCAVKWPKAELDLKPLLYIKGYLLHNYSFKYFLNDRTALLVKVDDLYDRQIKYGLGLEWKF